MAKKITRRELKHDEFVDAAFDFGHWLEKHWQSVAKWTAGGLLLVIAVVLWSAWARHARAEAGERLAEAVDRYELVEADGFADAAAAEELVASLGKLSGSAGEAGRLARFYRGATLFRLGRLEQAESELREVVSNGGISGTLGGTAQMMLVHVLEASGDVDSAMSLLEALVDDPAAAIPPGQALLELGRIHDEAGRADEARTQWQRIVDDFPQSVAAQQAGSLLD